MERDLEVADAVDLAGNGRPSGNGHRPAPTLEATDAIDFLAWQPPAQRWLVSDLVEQQGRIILAGGEGKGKSIMALTLAMQLATGHHALDFFHAPAYPSRVLYVDLELPKRMVHDRLRSINAKARLTDRGAMYVVSKPEGLLLRERGRDRAAFVAMVNDVHPDFLVLDPLYKAVLGDMAEEGAVASVLFLLDELRASTDTAVLVVHHLRKRAQGEAQRGRDESDVYGASVILRWPELVLVLGSEAGADHSHLLVSKDREGNLTGAGIKSLRLRLGGEWPASLEPEPPTLGGR